MYHYLQYQKGDVDQFIKDQQFVARDNSRTPFQWDATPNAGFTTSEPWIKVNADHVYINQEAQDMDGNSPLNYFRHLVQLRKDHQELIYGEYKLYDPEHEQVYTYTRTFDQTATLIIFNFSDELVPYTIPAALQKKQFQLISNNETSLQQEGHNITLLPWQALIFKLK
jgi:oligo-1,6-glucosidase